MAGLGERGIKRKALLSQDDPQASFKRQLVHEIREGQPYGPLTNRDRLIGPSASARQSLGSTPAFADAMNLAPLFRGMGPGASLLNQEFKFQLKPPDGIPRPRSAKNVLVTDANDEQQVDEVPTVLWPVNALLICDNLRLTWQAVGLHQLMFIHHPSSSVTVRHYCDTPHDSKLVSVSMLNALSFNGGEKHYDKATCYEASKPELLLDEWRVFGVVKVVTPLGSGRLAQHPNPVCAVQGPIRVINYWAACVPPPRQTARLWFVYVRRPRNPEIACKYRDAVRRLHELLHLPKQKRRTPDVLKEIAATRTLLDDFDLSNSSDEKALNTNFYYCWEPHVEYSNAHPPSYIWKGVNWEGAYKRIGYVTDRLASDSMGPCANLTKEILFPDVEHLERFAEAVQADSLQKHGVRTIEISYRG